MSDTPLTPPGDPWFLSFISSNFFSRLCYYFRYIYVVFDFILMFLVFNVCYYFFSSIIVSFLIVLCIFGWGLSHKFHLSYNLKTDSIIIPPSFVYICYKCIIFSKRENLSPWLSFLSILHSICALCFIPENLHV